MSIMLAAVGIGVALFLGYCLFVVAVARPDGTRRWRRVSVSW